MENKNIIIKKLIYNVVSKIPKGRFVTYGQVAIQVSQTLGKKVNPRYIGYVLHNNCDPKNIPCHRVVDSKGRLARNYRFGGWKEQRRRLFEEGVKFKDEKHVFQ